MFLEVLQANKWLTETFINTNRIKNTEMDFYERLFQRITSTSASMFTTRASRVASLYRCDNHSNVSQEEKLELGTGQSPFSPHGWLNV